ncbi:MAG TPA: TonB-dependent siderophore receptor [Rhizomicrobium sp.]|nr:TonB-dependent siderophore receptor [Rhizomicrobium sp.]
MRIEYTGGERRRAFEAATVSLGAAVLSSTALAQTPAATDAVETVNVTAERTHLAKLPDEIKNTPQSIDLVPLEVLQQQGVASLQEALKNVPGITLNAGEGGAHGDTVNLRGFSASDDFFLDGQRDTGTYFRDTFNTEAIEVYEGPASTLFGRGSTGGVINQVSKTPQLQPLDELRVSASDAPGYRATADINMVLSDDAALRVNLMGNDSHVTDRDYVRVRRWGIAPSLAYGIDTDTTFTLSFFNMEEDDIPDYGIPFVFGSPAPVPRKTYYGLPQNDVTRTATNIVTGKLEHDFGGGLTLADTIRYGNYWFDYRVTGPQFGPPCVAPAEPLSAVKVCRDRPSGSGTITTLMNETDLTYKFATGPFAHTMIGGFELDRETDDLVHYANQISLIPPTSVLHPDPFDTGGVNLVQTPTTRPDTTAKTASAYLIDTIDLTKEWSVEGAVRFDSFNADYVQPVGTPSTFHHTDNIASPRAALIYKPDDDKTFYFSYGTSYDPSAENLSLSSKNADLPPEKDHTFEVGAKMLWLDGQLSTTAALFDTKMENARISDPFIPALQQLAGTLESKGVQLGATGYITQNLELTAGYIHLSSTAYGLAGPGISGPNPNTAHNQANLWATYEFKEDVQIGTGINYLGRRPADPSGVDIVPSYVTWDAMASYRFDDHIALQLNATNLTNVYYYTNSYFASNVENHVLPGPGRTLMLTAILDL